MTSLIKKCNDKVDASTDFYKSDSFCVRDIPISEASAEVVTTERKFGNTPHSFSSHSQSSRTLEYILLDEALVITGFQERHLRNTMKKAGVTRIGSRSFDRKEFFQFWRYKSQVEDSPKLPGENSNIRQLRINKGWRHEALLNKA